MLIAPMEDDRHIKTSEQPREAPDSFAADASSCSLLKSFSNNVRFADLVVMAERLHPIPFRTRP